VEVVKRPVPSLWIVIDPSALYVVMSGPFVCPVNVLPLAEKVTTRWRSLMVLVVVPVESLNVSRRTVP
jgi:hypothetical protein